MPKSSEAKKLNWKLPPQAKDLPATQGIVHLVRKELKEDISSLRHEMKGEFRTVDARFKRVDARFDQVDARFNEVDARFNEVDAQFNDLRSEFAHLASKVSHLSSEVTRMCVLMEEQHAKNNIVLEGLTGLFSRQERVEKRTDDLEKTVGSFEIRKR